MNIVPGTIVQITNDAHRWFPCLLIVQEVKSWGVQAYLTMPTNDEEPNGNAYNRLSSGDYEAVGSAVVVAA